MIVRAARADDLAIIRRMVRDARLNPLDLDWRRFKVIADVDGSGLWAIGQVRRHHDGSRELASIVTTPEKRSTGLATTLIHALLADAPRPVYLTCRPELVGFYARLGFQERQSGLPPYFQGIAWLNRLARRLVGRPLIAVMGSVDQ